MCGCELQSNNDRDSKRERDKKQQQQHLKRTGSKSFVYLFVCLNLLHSCLSLPRLLSIHSRDLETTVSVFFSPSFSILIPLKKVAALKLVRLCSALKSLSNEKTICPILMDASESGKRQVVRFGSGSDVQISEYRSNIQNCCCHNLAPFSYRSWVILI